MEQNMKLSELLPRGMKKELARQFDRDEHSVNPMLDGVFASKTAQAMQEVAVSRSYEFYRTRLEMLEALKQAMHSN